MYGGDVVVFGYVVVETSSAFEILAPLVEGEDSVDVLSRGVVTVVDEVLLLSLVVVAGILVEVVDVLVVVGMEVANEVVVTVGIGVVGVVVVGALVVVGNGVVEVALEVEEEIGDVVVLFAVVTVEDFEEDVVDIAHPGIES